MKMASFFGEITGLSSRADFDDPNNKLPILKTLTTEFTAEPDDRHKSYNTILFSVGAMASAFVKSYFLTSVDAQPLAIVKSRTGHGNLAIDSSSDLDLHNGLSPIHTGLASIYICGADNIICDVHNSSTDELCVNLCNEILSSFPVTQAVVLAAYHMTAYKSNIREEKSFLRALMTSAFRENNRCRTALLPLPNIVSKFPAAVLTEFEVRSKVAIAFMNYAETMSLDSLNISVFEKVLQESIVSSNFAANEDAKSRLNAYLKSAQRSKSNLYA